MSTLQANNGTFDNFGMTAAEVITLTVMSSGILSIGTVSNILVILAVLLTSQLRESFTAILLLSLSFCDTFICAVYVPTYIYDINHGTVFEAFKWRMGFGFLLASLNGELVVTLDRFIYICYPYLYVNWVNSKFVAVAAFCTKWLLALALTLPLLATPTPFYGFIYVALVIVAIVALHLAMYCVARRESQKIALQYPATESHNQRMPIWSKWATAVSMAVMATLLCWLPIAILPAVVPPTSPSFKRYIKITAAFTSLSAAIHPFIFCWKLNHFREALVTCLRKLRRKLIPKSRVGVADMGLSHD